MTIFYLFLAASLVATFVLYAALSVGARAERAARAAQQERDAYRRRFSRHLMNTVSEGNTLMRSAKRESKLTRWNGWYR